MEDGDYVVKVNHPIFSSNDFRNDYYKYFLYGNLCARKYYEIETDNSNYAIFTFYNQDGETFIPSGDVWFWTKKDISKEKLDESIELLPDEGNIVYKSEINDFISNSSVVSINESKEMNGCYKCINPQKPKKLVDCKIEKVSIEDKEELIDLWIQNGKEWKFDFNREDVEKWIINWINNNNFYAYKKENKIICFATYQVIDNYARVEHAYTRKEYRGNGYMANLIFDMTSIILNNNLIPVLQTDINYESSNKSYQNVGYKLEDILIKTNFEKRYIKSL